MIHFVTFLIIIIMTTTNFKFTTYYKISICFNLIYGLFLTIFGCVILYRIVPYCHFLNFAIIGVPFSLIVTGTLAAVFVIFQFSEKKRYKIILVIVVLVVEIAMILFISLEYESFSNLILESHRSSFRDYLFINADREEWNKLQATLQCCGIDNSKDWNRILKRGLLPASCCSSYVKPDETFCRSTKADVYKVGCYQKLLDCIQRYSLYTVILEFVNVILQVLMLLSVFIKDRIWKGETNG